MSHQRAFEAGRDRVSSPSSSASEPTLNPDSRARELRGLEDGYHSRTRELSVRIGIGIDVTNLGYSMIKV